ncbi:MAG: Hcp family type VI secretion system effector [Planctomycetota bacterium]
MATPGSVETAREAEKRVDIFVKIKGIKGESTDDAHKEWLEALAMSWGVRQPAGTASQGPMARERADFDHLTISKVVDKASPMIYRYCAAGSHVDEVRIELCEQTAARVNFLTIVLNDVHVAAARITGSVTLGGVPRPIEEVAFVYSKIQWEYVPVGHDGSPGAAMTAGWDLEANTPQ